MLLFVQPCFRKQLDRIAKLTGEMDVGLLNVGDAAAQTEHVLNSIKSVIEAAGGTMADVTFNSIFITDWANYATINAVYARFFPGDKIGRAHA